MKKLSMILAASCFLAVTLNAFADEGNQGAWGDQGDGTYINPILPGDFSDPDVIRVGTDYYLITSSFQYSPGMAIMHSKDLVNWQYIGHCIPNIAKIEPHLNWDNKMDRYNKGVYAGSLRYHDGKFWMYFTEEDAGLFVTTAPKPEGPWSDVKLVSNIKNMDDPCPFWDDDGKAYLIMSSPGKKWYTHLYNMSPDGLSIDLASDRPLDPDQTSEGNKIYKFNGEYYVFHNQCQFRGRNRRGMMMRSKSIEGPWEKRVILETRPGKNDLEPNQGGLIDTDKGDWWFITHQGTGRWEGRASNLLHVKWIDGWPIPGTVDPTGAGNITWHEKKPIDGFPIVVPQSSDEFNGPALGLQWEWNYEPRADKWSLTERPGFLRLHAFKPQVPGDFFKAGNTLTQRVMGYTGGEIVVKADISGMADGQTAGVCAYWKPVAMLGVVQQGGVRTLQLSNDKKITVGPTLTGKDVWLKLIIDDKASCTFAYSLDGTTFIPIGDSFKFGWANYRGTRFALFNWNDDTEAGYIDFDYFHYDYNGPQNHQGAQTTGE